MDRTRTRNLWVGGVLVAIVALAIAWYVGSPRWTLHQMRSAAEAGDTDKLASYIDLPSLRASVRNHVEANVDTMWEIQRAVSKDGSGMVDRTVALSWIRNTVEQNVTPASIQNMFVVDKARAPEGMRRIDATGDDVRIERDGLNQFRLIGTSFDNKPGALRFVRHGLGWKFSGVTRWGSSSEA